MTTSLEVRCAACDAANDPSLARCWLCGEPLGKRQGEHTLVPPPREAAGMQFTLSTILLIVTLIAICLGMMRSAPGLAVLLVIAAVPALVRTVATERKRDSDVPATGAQKIVSFLMSLVLMSIIGIAGCIAFFAACLATCTATQWSLDQDAAIWLAIGLGTLSAIAVVWILMYKTWPRRR